MPSLLMVPPDHYGVEYEINPWMRRSNPASPEIARRQWEGLYRALTEEAGATVLQAAPQPGMPDMVFTANAGLMRGRRVVLSRFRYPERQREEEPFRRWFQEQGYEMVEVPPGTSFEGEGDALFLGDTLFSGYYHRTEARAHRLVGELLGCRVLSLELVDPHFYHLDTCFCPLDAETVAYYPAAFDEYGRRVIEAHVPHRIEVEAEEAARFACNAVVLGRHVVLNAGCPMLERQLRERGFVSHSTPLDEFLKAGGSAKCLTLHLDRWL